MTRFFFDCTNEQQVIFDYVGHEFKSAAAAVEFAQEKLLLLRNSLAQDWVGWSINVSNPEGCKLHSLPIDSAGMMPLEQHQQPTLAPNT
jgi:hypothetical protein